MIKNYLVIVDIMNFNKLIQIINEVQIFEEIQWHVFIPVSLVNLGPMLQ